MSPERNEDENAGVNLRPPVDERLKPEKPLSEREKMGRATERQVEEAAEKDDVGGAV